MLDTPQLKTKLFVLFFVALSFIQKPDISLAETDIYKQVQVDDIANTLAKVDLSKSKYETTEQWQERLSKAIEADKISLKIDEYESILKTDYNADKSKYSVVFNPVEYYMFFPDSEDGRIRNKLIFSVKTKVGSLDKYIGQNAFGAKQEITRSDIDRYFVIVENTYDLKLKLHMKDDLGMLDYGVNSFELSPQEAQSLDENFSLVVNCSLLKSDYLGTPLFHKGTRRIKPTRENPEDLTIHSSGIFAKVNQLKILNKKTGKIYLEVDTSVWP